MKKGEGATGAGAVLAIIVGFIVLYFLLIPPDVREEYLNLTDEDEGADGGEKEKMDANVLLLESPGTLSEQEKDEYTHDLDAFNLVTRADDAVLKDLGSFYIEAPKQTKEAVLVVNDPKNTESIKLSFNAANHNNRLIIELNDVEVFNSEVSGFWQIALENVKKENILKFYSPSPAWYNFLGKNFYELNDVKITATVEDVSNREATQTFFISPSEYQGMQEAYLRYFVECRPTTAGQLRVYINGILLSSKVPDCSSAAKINIDPESLVPRTNTLRFYAEKGSYLIDQVAVRTTLKEALITTYYFEINATQWGWIGADKKEVELNMEFADVDATKRAELEINGHKTMIDTEEATYTKTISKNHLKEKNNYLQIIPEDTIGIVELKVKLVD